jgi:hypothetical protein
MPGIANTACNFDVCPRRPVRANNIYINFLTTKKPQPVLSLVLTLTGHGGDGTR